MPGYLDAPNLSSESLQKYREYCDRFHQALLDGENPQIEAWVAQVPNEIQPWLLHELLYIECVYRFSRGEPVRAGDYADRFPGQHDLVDSAVEKAYHTLPETSVVAHEDDEVA